MVPDLDAHHIPSASCVGDEIWLGTARKGLFRVGPHGQVRQSNTGRADGGLLKSSRIAKVFADRAAGVWVSSFRSGLHRYDLSTNQFGAVESEMTVTAIGPWADSEDLRIGILAGQLVRLRCEDETMTEVRDQGSEITSIAQQADCLWVGTRGNGLFAFDGDVQVIVNERHHAGMPEAMLSDEVYSLWLDET